MDVLRHLGIPEGRSRLLGNGIDLDRFRPRRLPVIATDIRGCGRVVDHGVTRLLVAPGDGAARAEAIGELAADAAKRRAMASRAQAEAERESISAK